MLKDASRAVDDLAAICKAVVKPNEPIHRCSPSTARFVADEAARKVMCAVLPAAMRGVDVGAALADTLSHWARRNGVDVSECEHPDADYHAGTPVLEFHEVFDHPISTDPTHVPPIDKRVLRIKMLAEELLETARAFGVTLACATGNTREEDGVNVIPVLGWDYDPVEAADGLADLRYVVDGGNLLCGFPGEKVLAEVHRSNMSKLAADGSVLRREDGKILKGPNYFKPDIAGVLGLTK